MAFPDDFNIHPPDEDEDEAAKNKPTKKRRTYIISIVVVVILVAVGITVFVILSNPGKEEDVCASFEAPTFFEEHELNGEDAILLLTSSAYSSSALLRGTIHHTTESAILQIISPTSGDVIESTNPSILQNTMFDDKALSGTTTQWSAEINLLENATKTFKIIYNGPCGTNGTEQVVDMRIRADPTNNEGADDDTSSESEIFSPAFTETPQLEEFLKAYNASTGILTFVGEHSSILRLGNGLGSGPVEDIAPDGYLRIITGFKYDSDKNETFVSTRQAEITEFVRRMKVSESELGAITAIEPLEDEVESDLTRLLSLRNADTTAVAQGSALEEAGYGERLLKKIGPKTSLEAVFIFQPEVEFDLDIDWQKPTSCILCPPIPSIERFFFNVSSRFEGEFALGHRVDSILKKKGSLSKKWKGVIARWIIPTPLLFPIVIVFKGELEPLKYEVGLSAVIFEVTCETTLHYWTAYEYKSDGTGRGAMREDISLASPPRFDLEDIDADSGMEVTAFIGSEVEFEATLYGAVGIELEAEAGLTLTAVDDNLERQIEYELSLGAAFSGGPEIEVFEFELEFGITFAQIEKMLVEGQISYTLPPSIAPSMGPSVVPSVVPSLEPSTSPCKCCIWYDLGLGRALSSDLSFGDFCETISISHFTFSTRKWCPQDVPNPTCPKLPNVLGTILKS